MALDPRLRSPKETPLFAIGVVFSSFVWLAVAISLVGILYGAFVLGAVLIAHAFFLAHVRGNGVRVTERQLPALHARVKAAAARLGLADLPEVYVIQAGGALNAFATKLLARRFVIVYSDLIDGCRDERQLDFVLGHELGHLAAGHLSWNAFLAPFRLAPWLGAAYSRACEYTSDRAGYAAVGEVEPAMRGLAVLAVGGRLASQVDLPAFLEQRAETGGFVSGAFELVSSHPYLCKRAAALQEWLAPGTASAVSRHPLAYPFAPFFSLFAGGAAGAAMTAVMVIGILAAIAIPNFVKYTERARQAREEAAARAAATEPYAAPDEPTTAAVPDANDGAPADE
jgi:Zn-dependent protease with chaperone function